MRNSHMIPRRIGAILKRYMVARELSVREAARFLGTNATKLDRYLKGENQKVEPGLIIGWLHMLGAPEEVVREAEAMAVQTRSRTTTGWESSLPEWFSPFVGLESVATAIDSYQPEALPGMLQTREYAEAMAEASVLQSAEDAQASIEIRLARQEVLERQEGRPSMRYVLTEQCLRVIGQYDFCDAQIRRLHEINEIDRVSVHVVPTSAGLHASAGGPFTIMTFDDTPDPDTVYLESQNGARYESAPKLVAGYRRLLTATLEVVDPLERSPWMSKWRKSTRSNPQGDCVEFRSANGSFLVRDSKLGESSPVLGIDSSSFTAMLDNLKRRLTTEG
ncbi:Scr1 family TA system antitoxin-like transcriptional regulator [Glycomyces rhizosphaerae]|uniref:Scr1 family TA system antitoxin-like transcriptional regulator n=1 Tax=Glycomyces rhizosphaerae TaxID=2054422 RepID=A0ABV7Q0S6_9ACTN